MSNTSLNYSFKKESILFSLFITTFILYFFYKDYSFFLTGSPTLQISQATLNGVDVSKRIELFYKIIGSFALLLPLFFLSINRMIIKLKLHYNDLKILTLIATTGFFLLLTAIYGIENNKGIEISACLFLLVSLFVAFKHTTTIFRIFINEVYFSGILIISFITLSIFILLFNSNPIITKNLTAYFLAILLTLIIVTFLLKKYTKVSLKRFFTFLLPINLVPIILFLSIESVFYFKLKSDFFIAYKWFFLGLFFSVFIIITGYGLKKATQSSTRNLIAKFYAPSALLIFLLLTIYSPFIQQPSDWFELANPAIAQMRIFSFNEIPFADYLSSHLFSEQFYGIFYHLFFGFDGSLDFLTYQFLYLLIFYFIAFLS